MRDIKKQALVGAIASMGVMTRDAGGSKDEYEKLAGQLKTRLTTLDELIEKKQKLLTDDKADTETRNAAIEEMQKSVKEVGLLSARFEEFEQKMVRGVQDGELDPNSIGGLLSRNEGLSNEIKSIKNSRGKVQIDGVSARNTVLLGTINTAGNINDAKMVAATEDTLTIVNMINWIPTTAPLIPYVRESAVTFMADIVPEGTLKPDSSLTFGIDSLEVDVIAHWIQVSNQVLDDAPALAAYIEGRMAYGVRLKLEYLVINGDTKSFKGLMKVGNSLTIVSNDNAIDTISTAKAKAYANFLPPETVILNPQDWADIEQVKGSDGHYIFGSPGAAVQPILWGLKVMQSPAMPVGKFWAGNITMATEGYIRQDVTVELSTEDSDNFRKNLVTIRAEMRAAFGVVMPDAAVTGDLVNVGP
ncbi:phage major capsid protein [Psychrobacter glaciei]|uniref:phage major capsid protein n=1 Tax=Psychrobacter glaciei TaxID=619771 RepID=UPI001F0581AC|nr:phage major capsid protein [Psychrobacter glaciei]MCH1781742.1 phage major capsid protein [Psychrobacter glaciei]